MVFQPYPFSSFLFGDSEWSVCWIDVWMVMMVVAAVDVDVDVDVDWRRRIEFLAWVETIVQVQFQSKNFYQMCKLVADNGTVVSKQARHPTNRRSTQSITSI